MGVCVQVLRGKEERTLLTLAIESGDANMVGYSRS